MMTLFKTVTTFFATLSLLIKVPFFLVAGTALAFSLNLVTIEQIKPYLQALLDTI